MADWIFINKHRTRSGDIHVPSQYWSDDSWGWNGLFRLPLGGSTVRCVVSDGSDAPPEYRWQHVSVSVEGDPRPPRWATMCWVKDLFWEPEDVVMQLHPRRSEYVNQHPATLHLWRPLPPNPPIPEPLSIMVGMK